MSDDTFQHSITRAHIWLAAMIVIGALNGPWWCTAVAALVSLVHLVLALTAPTRTEEALNG